VTAEEINGYLDAGFKAILVGVDAAFLGAAARQVLGEIKR
jgi:hypothetical protein